MGAPTGELARGLYFYHARYYDPTLARFIQPDTIVPDPGDPQSLNRYSYAANNPVRYTDPSGHCIPGENCPGDQPNNGAQPPPPSSSPPSGSQPSQSGVQTASGNVTQVYWALGKNKQWWAAPHCSQQDAFSCGPTSVAMILNALTSKKWTQNDIPVPLTRWFYGGATRPDWLAKAFNENAAKEGIAYRAEVRMDASQDELIDALQKGYPVTTLVMFGPVRGHYVNVVGYDMKTDTVHYLDPAMTSNEVKPMPWQNFDTGVDYGRGDWAWSQRVFWLGSHNRIMIVYHP